MGKRYPNPKYIEKICEALGMKLVEFYGTKEDLVEKYTEQGHYETSYANGYPVREYHPGREVDNRYYLYRMFYVNARGIIYYYQWKYE
jgi:hypothetical protein